MAATRGRRERKQPLRAAAIAKSKLTSLSGVSPRLASPVITFVTDFGNADYFVGAMKGVVLSVNPNALLVDLTHEIAAHDIPAAAFMILASYNDFPAGTIHVAVVDPGVGSDRRPLVIEAGNYLFVGPDNGIFSYVLERESEYRIFHVTNQKYFRKPVSATFHGRDVFSPVAAVLSLGVNLRELGKQIDDPVRLESLRVLSRKDGKLRGRIIHIDHFGNCITNFTREDLTGIGQGVRLEIDGKTIKTFKEFFVESPGRADKVFAIWGSAGFLELAAANTSAARLLKVRTGQEIRIV